MEILFSERNNGKEMFRYFRRAFNYDMRKNETKTTHNYIRIG